MREKSLAEQEYELLQANMMGDIREDIQVMGLDLKDLWWIMLMTMLIGAVPFVFPLPVWFKMAWFISVFLFNFIGRILKWPFRRGRFLLYLRQKKEGTGEQMDKLLNAQEDGWMYRSGETLMILVGVRTPPWAPSLLNQKRKRLNGYEAFLRQCIREGFSVHVSAEQVPDFRHDLWNELTEREEDTPGLEDLKQGRLQMWKAEVDSGISNRPAYYIRLDIEEFRVDVRERDDEPDGATKQELKRFRFMAEMREKKDRVLAPLEDSQHECTLLSGYSHAELIGRWWDRTAWREWKASEGTWEEPSAEEVFVLQSGEDEEWGEQGKPNAADDSEQSDLADQADDEVRTVNSLIQTEEEPDTSEEDPLASVLKAISNPDGNKSDDAGRRGKWRIAAVIAGMIGLPGLVLAWIKKELHMLLRRFKDKRVNKTLANEALMVTTETDESAEQAEPANSEARAAEPLISGVYLITAPTPSGQTFLAANVSAAGSSPDHKVSLIDLSPDQGTLTVLNPRQAMCDYDGWQAWESKHVPGLTVYTPWFTPTAYPTSEQVQQLIEQLKGETSVLVDMPWTYPARKMLQKCYESVAVVDADYHHWLRWEEELPSCVWNGRVWLNMADPSMIPRMAPIIRERFGKNASAVFPYFPTASHWIYLGRPLAVEPQARRYFISPGKEEDAC
ncbi:hypothetical protein [Paenibacillus polymyxa]|uniref:hypothetical protein n=1 Tax=Paenibacillus polymyxa TaxID=1406 RepID=UPI0032AFB80B